MSFLPLPYNLEKLRSISRQYSGHLSGYALVMPVKTQLILRACPLTALKKPFAAK
jgi:hypothetical protein